MSFLPTSNVMVRTSVVLLTLFVNETYLLLFSQLRCDFQWNQILSFLWCRQCIWSMELGPKYLRWLFLLHAMLWRYNRVTKHWLEMWFPLHSKTSLRLVSKRFWFQFYLFLVHVRGQQVRTELYVKNGWIWVKERYTVANATC
jgi:hypothetical protein